MPGNIRIPSEGGKTSLAKGAPNVPDDPAVPCISAFRDRLRFPGTSGVGVKPVSREGSAMEGTNRTSCSEPGHIATGMA